MTYRFYYLFLLFISFTAFAQKIPYYTTLDSLKKTGNTPVDNDIRDSIRELAHDYADSIIDHFNNRSRFELSLDITSRQLIFGRQGPAHDIIGSPALRYQHRVGFYIALGLDVYRLKYKQINITRHPLHLDTTAVDKIVADVIPTIGYTKTFFDKWDVDISLGHTFISYGKDVNFLATELNISNGFDFWDYITANISYSLLLGGSSQTPATEKQYSNILSFELNHDFRIYRFIGATIFSIQPSLSVDVGNDNYVRGRILAREQNGGLTASKAIVDDFFGLLNVEGAVNIQYRIKNLAIDLMPRVAIPFNVVPANALDAATFRNNQSRGAIFYFAASIRYNFRFWKEKK